jgi:hypothetical protein
MRQDIIHQQGGTVGHAPCPTTGAETASLTAKRYQFFIVAGFAPDPEKTMFKSATFQVLVKFFCDVCWQHLAMTGQFSLKLRPVLLNDLVE